MGVALTVHAAARWLERGIPVTAAIERWLTKIAVCFTSEPKKFKWGKGKKILTVVGIIRAGIPVIITVY